MAISLDEHSSELCRLAVHPSGDIVGEDSAPGTESRGVGFLLGPSECTAHGSKRGIPQCPEGYIYADFDPILLQQKAQEQFLEFETFDAALDEYYSKVLCLLMCTNLLMPSIQSLWRLTDLFSPLQCLTLRMCMLGSISAVELWL